MTFDITDTPAGNAQRLHLYALLKTRTQELLMTSPFSQVVLGPAVSVKANDLQGAGCVCGVCGGVKGVHPITC